LILGKQRYFVWKKKLSKRKMTICAKNLGAHGPGGHPLATPMCVNETKGNALA